MDDRLELITDLIEKTFGEHNDELIRKQVKESIERILADIKQKRGLYDFYVVCDETNNPPEVVDRHELIVSVDTYPNPDYVFIEDYKFGPDGMLITRTSYPVEGK